MCELSLRGDPNVLYCIHQDIKSNNTTMKGVTVLLAGEVCQKFPAIPKRSKAEGVNTCFKYSYTKIGYTSEMRFRSFDRF